MKLLVVFVDQITSIGAELGFFGMGYVVVTLAIHFMLNKEVKEKFIYYFSSFT